MVKRKSNSYFLWFTLAVFTFSACRDKVTITRSYIYSTTWAKGGNQGYQGFEIAKIRLKDSTVSVFNKGFNHYFLDEHIVDSSFCYGAGGNNSNTTHIDKMPRIYFNKESIYYIWYKCWNITKSCKTIGVLELNTWYIITGLGGTEDFYVYIDKGGESHTFSSGPTNW